MELTLSEKPIADLIAQGYSEKEIASRLFLSPKTIHTHTYNIRKKNGLRSCVDIAREYILSLEDPKQYFAALLFLMLQLSITVNSPDMELRRSPRPVRISSRTMARSNRKIQYS